MKELIRKVLKESREVKTEDFSGLEKIIVKETEKLIKDYPYLDSVYGVNGIDVVDDDLHGRVLVTIKPELIKYFNKSRSDYDEVNNFYIYYKNIEWSGFYSIKNFAKTINDSNLLFHCNLMLLHVRI
jgi:hypothetical protein